MKILQRPGAYVSPAPSRARHMRWLLAAAFARRSTRRMRRASRGQTLLIFALSFTVLIGFMGLAIDTVRLYDTYARMQRAAEAGALAGVIYMPNNYTTNLTTSPGDNAVCRAWNEVFKNSFGQSCADPTKIGSNYCPSSVSATEVAVCSVKDASGATKPYDLAVSITESVNVLFLSALNVAPISLTVTAVAEYLPPVQIASDPSGQGGTGSWGTFGECGNSGSSASAACTGTGVRNWAGNINGPGELKEQGDPLVSCAEGPSTGGPDPSANTAPNPEPYTTYTGLPTNHPQNGLASNTEPTGCTNSDTSSVFSGAAYIDTTGAVQTHTGYAFYVNMENAAATTNVWIWNAPFDPSPPPSCNGRQGTGQSAYDIYYQFNCKGNSGSPYPYYPGTTCGGQDPYACTDPNLTFSVTYSIYDISLANPTAGKLVAVTQAFPMISSFGGCASGSFYQETSTGLNVTANCVKSLCVKQWCPLATNERGATDSALWNGFTLLQGHDYRVMVVASDYGTPTDYHRGWGGHSFSMKLCPSSGVNQSNVQTCAIPAGATISGWNLSDALFTFPGNGTSLTQTTEYPLGVISNTYSGRTIDVGLYDPGDLIGNSGGVSIYGAVPNLPGLSDPCAATSAQLQAAGFDPTVNGSTFYFPNNERTTLFNGNIPAIEPSQNNDLIYNGLWVDEQISMPSTYAGGAWTLCAQAPLLQDSDVLGIRVLALGQSPVHLVQ